MKKINSIWYGASILNLGLCFLILIPLILYIISIIFEISAYLLLPIKISVFVGSLILLFLFLLLTIELGQDRRLNAFYQKNRNKKIKISNIYYECQNCGNSKVKKSEKSCSVCGIKFLDNIDETDN